LACHSGKGAMGNFDLGATADTAHAKLLGADGTGGASTCAAKPKYVVPNNTASSYFLTMVDGKATGRCTGNVMPLGTSGLSADDLKTLSDWINAGAKR
jgi:cytochrome c553